MESGGLSGAQHPQRHRPWTTRPYVSYMKLSVIGDKGVCVRVVMGGCRGRLENGAGTASWRVSLPGLRRSVDAFLESGAI